MTPTNALMSTAQAAEALGKSARTVQRMVEAGQLIPAVIVPAGYLFNRADIERLAQAAA